MRAHFLLQTKVLTVGQLEGKHQQTCDTYTSEAGAYYKCRDFRNLRPARIRNDVERERVRANLNTLVDEYEERQSLEVECRLQGSKRLPDAHLSNG